MRIIKPENAFLLRLFDYFAAVTFGVVAAVVTGYLLPESWPMILAMPLAMILGMISALPLLALFFALLGGFEIIMMSMQIGMLAGMAGVMAPDDTLFGLITIGAITGLVVQITLHMMDINLHGEVLRERPCDE